MLVRLAFEARVGIEGGRVARVVAFTGRAVKGLVASLHPRAGAWVKLRGVHVVKPLAVTPLYRLKPGGRLEALYPGGPSPGEVRGPRVYDGERVYFEVGLGDELAADADTLVERLESGWHPLLGATEPPVVVEDVKLVGRVEWDPARDPPLVDLESVDKVSLVIASPALPAPPWGGRFHRLVPDPFYLLGVNAIALNPVDPVAAAAAVAATLSPSHTVTATTRVWWVRYKPGVVEPALIGYMVLHVERRGVEDVAARILSHAALMNAGRSRVEGFGAVRVRAGEETLPYPLPATRGEPLAARVRAS